MDIAQLEQRPDADGGIWFPFPESDAEIRIARANNPKFRAAYQEALEDEEIKAQVRAAKDDETDPAWLHAASFALVTGWKNLESGKQPFEYTPENARLLFKRTEFREFVLITANTRSNFRAQLEEEAAGNSLSASDGTSG